MVRLRARKSDTNEAVTDPNPDVDPGDDHALHLSEQVCSRCGREIGPGDEARRTASGDCVHLTC